MIIIALKLFHNDGPPIDGECFSSDSDDSKISEIADDGQGSACTPPLPEEVEEGGHLEYVCSDISQCINSLYRLSLITQNPATLPLQHEKGIKAQLPSEKEEIQSESTLEGGQASSSSFIVGGYQDFLSSLCNLTGEQVRFMGGDQEGVTHTEYPSMSELAFQNCEGYETLAHLLRKGVKVNSKDYSEETPLSYAAKLGNEAAARMLFEHSYAAGISSLADNGGAPLHFATNIRHKADQPTPSYS